MNVQQEELTMKNLHRQLKVTMHFLFIPVDKLKLQRFRYEQELFGRNTWIGLIRKGLIWKGSIKSKQPDEDKVMVLC